MISRTIFIQPYFFLTLIVGGFVLFTQLQGKTLFLMRGLGDASYGSAIFPALVTVPLSFFALLSLGLRKNIPHKALLYLFKGNAYGHKGRLSNLCSLYNIAP